MDSVKLRTQAFSIVAHIGRNERWRVGYHCGNCGKFYATGRYTIETPTHILGNGNMATCCGVEYPLPLLFEEIPAIEEFLRSLNRTKGGTAGRLIARHTLIPAHFDPTKRPPETTLH